MHDNPFDYIHNKYECDNENKRFMSKKIGYGTRGGAFTK